VRIAASSTRRRSSFVRVSRTPPRRPAEPLITYTRNPADFIGIDDLTVVVVPERKTA
jgi:hypothetical protein